MSFYNLSELMFTRPYFSAMDCLLNEQKAVYCSSEITSGWNLFNAMRTHDVKSQEALKAKLGAAWFEKNIVESNTKSADDFARSIRSALADNTPVVTPGPLKIPLWDQPEYLAFWEELIRTRVMRVHFNGNWEFSNGCTFEFAVALDASKDTFDSHGAPLSASAAVLKITNAIEKIKTLNQDFDTKKLERNLERIQSSTVRERLSLQISHRPISRNIGEK